jgi:hypothetical protein
MMLMTYVTREEGDPESTEVAGIKFRSGIPVELPPGKEWLGRKYLDNGNPWFRVEVDPD